MKAGLGTLLFFVTATICVAVVLAEWNDEEFNKFSKASCNFTLNFLRHLSTKDANSNIVFSPSSISVLLAILQQGAKDNTLTQLENILSLKASQARKYFDTITILKEEKDINLEWGNRLYIKKGLELHHNFQDTVKNSFGTDVKELDPLTTSAEQSVAAAKINKWVSEVTHNKISNLVDPSNLTPQTIMLLINAIFFKGNWLKHFKKGRTSEKKFEITEENSVMVPFMMQRQRFYSDKDTRIGAKWIVLPFQNERFAMIFVLPSRKHKLSHLIKKLNADTLHEIFSHRGLSDVKVTLPKFKISKKFSVVETLQELGLTDVFSKAANLKGMTDETVQVSEIIHEANVEIDEKGSSASAATMSEFSRMRIPTLSFNANQPFLFFITDTQTNIPLFAGKIVNPSA